MTGNSIPRIASFINRSKGAQRLLKTVNRNPAICSAFISFGLASVIRPSLIGCFKFSDSKDKKYSQASAIATGLVELGTTVALFIPLNKSIEKTSRALYKTVGSFYEGNNKALRQFKSITNRVAKLLLLVPISFTRFSLVKPIVKNFFEAKKEKGLDVKA